MSNAKIVFISDNANKSKNVIEKIQKIENGKWVFKLFEISDFMTVLPLEGPDCVILHLASGKGKDEGKYISEVHSFDDNLPVIAISGKGKLEDAVQIMKDGAYDYFTASSDIENIVISIRNAIRLYGLTKRVYLLEQQAGWKSTLDDIIGHSGKMQEIFQLITNVAKSNATVLILGESGTGKELVAKAIHNNSKRSKKSFIDINCGAIPGELLENELFGHEKGSYTGADRQYIGSCERAHQGTLFLDEICEMDPSLQVKILRLLQERTFNRVGGVGKITSDIRFIAATNREIESEVKKGNFREDLYYRLNVVPVKIPALRERREDVLPIAKHFLEKYCSKSEKIFVDIASDAADAMMHYEWPGNVRELENVIERIVVLNNDTQLKLKHLPQNIKDASGERKERVSAPVYMGDDKRIIPLDMVEKYAIEAAMDKCGGSVAETAKRLQIGQATLYRKIKQYGLNVK